MVYNILYPIAAEFLILTGPRWYIFDNSFKVYINALDLRHYS